MRIAFVVVIFRCGCRFFQLPRQMYAKKIERVLRPMFIAPAWNRCEYFDTNEIQTKIPASFAHISIKTISCRIVWWSIDGNKTDQNINKTHQNKCSQRYSDNLKPLNSWKCKNGSYGITETLFSLVFHKQNVINKFSLAFINKPKLCGVLQFISLTFWVHIHTHTLGQTQKNTLIHKVNTSGGVKEIRFFYFNCTWLKKCFVYTIHTSKWCAKTACCCCCWNLYCFIRRHDDIWLISVSMGFISCKCVC